MVTSIKRIELKSDVLMPPDDGNALIASAVNAATGASLVFNADVFILFESSA